MVSGWGGFDATSAGSSLVMLRGRGFEAGTFGGGTTKNYNLGNNEKMLLKRGLYVA